LEHITWPDILIVTLLAVISPDALIVAVLVVKDAHIISLFGLNVPVSPLAPAVLVLLFYIFNFIGVCYNNSYIRCIKLYF